jgi:hypothetical protein
MDHPIWWNRLASLSNELIRKNTLFLLEGDSGGCKVERKALQKSLFPGILSKRENSSNNLNCEENNDGI